MKNYFELIDKNNKKIYYRYSLEEVTLITGISKIDLVRVLKQHDIPHTERYTLRDLWN